MTPYPDRRLHPFGRQSDSHSLKIHTSVLLFRQFRKSTRDWISVKKKISYTSPRHLRQGTPDDDLRSVVCLLIAAGNWSNFFRRHQAMDLAFIRALKSV